MKVVVVGPFDEDALAELRSTMRVAHVTDISPEAVRPHLEDADALISRRLIVDAKLLDAAPRLRLILKPGSGIDEINTQEAARRGIAVLNTPGVNAPAVAELTVGLMVALTRQVAAHHARLRETRRWEREEGTELCGKTLGVVGVGHVGSRVARVAQALEMLVLGCDPYVDPSAVPVPLVPFEHLLDRSDMVTLHVPLTEETKGLVAASALDRMRDGAYLVNMSRGEVVDEVAVIEALDSGRLAGYAADVLAGEVPGMKIASPLLDHPRVLLTPHLGAWTKETDRRVWRAAVAALRQWMATISVAPG